jgi:hypothetical protein
MAASNDLALRNAKPRDKPVKISVGGGLYLFVQPSGIKLWRLAYRFGGKQKLLSFGPYPRLSLVEAREARDVAKKLLARGVDPSAERKSQRRAAKLYL